MDSSPFWISSAAAAQGSGFEFEEISDSNDIVFMIPILADDYYVYVKRS